jgi:exopolyphosphatase/guanosine-5'-triphosphate,3'-diphosphate pyrophosphatase
MSTEIIGLSHMEREIVASVVRFNHSPFSYYGEQSSESGLDRESYLVVAKLTAILRLANSLDRSHKQKFKGVKAALRDNELILTVDTREDTSLEKRAFELNEKFFMEVYSIKPVLKQKKSL